jgi:hypothetical protein
MGCFSAWRVIFAGEIATPFLMKGLGPKGSQAHDFAPENGLLSVKKLCFI